MNAIRRIGRILAPDAEKEEDGRDKWGSRTSFVLAAMGGAVGLGNLLRYPSQVFVNNGLQWFIPYLIALFFLGIPSLLLEIAIGQAYRGGCIVALNGLSRRTKGVGLAVVMNGYIIVTYYVPILAWVMHYFRRSFAYAPLPWMDRVDEYYMEDVVANIAPEDGSFNPDGSVATYVNYPGRGMVPETVGWCAFVWFITWLCMFKGVGVTGRVVYFTMGLPLITIIILLGGSLALPNAVEGVRMYMGHWDSSKLASGAIWQSACGQIFFSIGVGMGYFTSYASYNSKYANTVQDALIIGISNSLVEVIAAFAPFGVVGYLGLRPETGETLGTFTMAFLTYPEAVTSMPGANFWAILFFFTLMLLGLSSAFALFETLATLICDTAWGRKIPRTTVTSVLTVVSFLLSLLYCTEFGFYLLDAVDTWTNNMGLLFAVSWECLAATTVYRYKDVISEVGIIAFSIYNAFYLFALLFGLVIAHTVGPEAGAGVGFGLYMTGAVASVFLAKTPATKAPRFWGNNTLLNKFWWVAFYSGNQVTRDLNIVVGAGKAWSIPVFWAPVLKYITVPILAIVFAFAYPAFNKVRNDPLHIFGFATTHVGMIVVVICLIFPRWLNVFVPPERQIKSDPVTVPGMTVAPLNGLRGVEQSVESGVVSDMPIETSQPAEKRNSPDAF